MNELRQAVALPSGLRDRFLSHVELGARDPDACWEFMGSRTHEGYGRVMVAGHGSTTAQRVAYLLFVGDVPAGETVDHLCRNRACVNPWHLEAVPHRVNVLRGVGAGALNARKTHCPRGHELVQGRTQRYCLTCKRKSGRESARRARGSDPTRFRV